MGKSFTFKILGFDHGAGHPLLFMDDAKAPNCLKNNGLKDLGNYSEWPKVAGAVIKAKYCALLTIQQYSIKSPTHTYMYTYHFPERLSYCEFLFLPFQVHG